MMKQLKFIDNHTDERGVTHSILVYGKDDVRWGNMTFDSIEKARGAIDKTASYLDEGEDNMKFVIRLDRKMGGAVWFVGKSHCFVTGQRRNRIKIWKTKTGAERAMKNLNLENEAKVTEMWFK